MSSRKPIFIFTGEDDLMVDEEGGLNNGSNNAGLSFDQDLYTMALVLGRDMASVMWWKLGGCPEDAA